MPRTYTEAEVDEILLPRLDRLSEELQGLKTDHVRLLELIEMERREAAAT